MNTFKEVAIRRRRTGACAKCGNPAVRTRKFFQTVNPFNKTAGGSVKNETQIAQEITSEFNRWCEEPLFHAKCE